MVRKETNKKKQKEKKNKKKKKDFMQILQPAFTSNFSVMPITAPWPASVLAED